MNQYCIPVGYHLFKGKIMLRVWCHATRPRNRVRRFKLLNTCTLPTGVPSACVFPPKQYTNTADWIIFKKPASQSPTSTERGRACTLVSQSAAFAYHFGEKTHASDYSTQSAV